MAIRIVLVDDHKVLRHGLSQALKGEEDMEIVGQAENGYEAVKLAHELVPDVMMMDIAMPELNGIEATRQILKAHPQIKIITLSMHSNKKFIHEMFKSGARGYLLKDCEYSELINAIRVVMQNKIYISPSITGVVIENYMMQGTEEKQNAFAILSDREREVLQLIAEGKTTKQVARMLHVSPKTVEGHRTRIMHKLEIDSIANLTKYAIREGLTSAEAP
ncbi:MAG: DNA-binding response regulator [Planctomycetes bacterium GWF2_41_51]|nr:MAG: DNA-binding response regulator [Planctomycetes bacterium GWF2_41_51]